jgi:hypothetical protein
VLVGENSLVGEVILSESTISTYVHQEITVGRDGYGGTLSITNTGTLVGTGGSSPSVAVLTAQPDDLVINSGVIIGGIGPTSGSDGILVTYSSIVNTGTIAGGGVFNLGGNGISLNHGTVKMGGS